MAKKTNYFLSHVRQGITTLADHAAVSGKRMSITTRLNVKATNKEDNETIEKQVLLFGPGDVTGINNTAIAKVSPPKSTSNFEPSLIPFIEFSEPDFLWRYSSRQANEPHEENWIPWLTLIVLKTGDDEAEFSEEKRPNTALPPQIKIKPHAVLPDLKESWRWAHVNTFQFEGSSQQQIKEQIKTSPNDTICRLLCPRKLKPETKYRAFLIPTFRIGADTALGISDGTEDRKALSWETPSQEISGMILPYFYDWQFTTREEGNFENLVSKLRQRDIENLGFRPIDCSTPGYGLNEDNEFELLIESALKSVNTQYDDQAIPIHKKQQVADLLNSRNQRAIGQNSILRVTPPVYGEWYAGIENQTLNANSANWLEEVNLDFRYRAAAGLGVQFIQKNQEGLMKSAWEQYNKIKKVNKELNLSRFGREISTCMEKRLKGLNKETFFKISLPLQNKILIDDAQGDHLETISPYLKRNEITHHVTRPKVKKYMNRRKGMKAGSELVIKSSQLVSKAFKIKGVKKHAHKNQNHRYYRTAPRLDAQNEWIDAVVAATKIAIDPKKTIEKKIESRTNAFRALEKPGTTQLQSLDTLRPIKWHPEFHRPMYRFLRDLSEEYILSGLENIPMNTVGVLETNQRFIEAFMLGLNHEMASELRWREFPTDMRGSYFRSFWDTTIYSVDDDEKETFRDSTIGIKMHGQIKKEFPGDVYHSFSEIENAYAAANPTDEQKRVATHYEKAIEQWLLTREEDKDIDVLTNWEENSSLGDHQIQGQLGNEGDQNQIVILLRGELLQKFSNAIIYLTRKKVALPNEPDLNNPSKRIFPIFEGDIQPDIVFLGFPIATAMAEDYFLIFEERMTDLRYGLDITSGESESDLSWEDFTELNEEGYLDGIQPVHVNESDWNSAAYVGKVMVQKPVRVSVKLSTLIPN